VQFSVSCREGGEGGGKMLVTLSRDRERVHAEGKVGGKEKRHVGIVTDLPRPGKKGGEEKEDYIRDFPRSVKKKEKKHRRTGKKGKRN